MEKLIDFVMQCQAAFYWIRVRQAGDEQEIQL